MTNSEFDNGYLAYGNGYSLTGAESADFDRGYWAAHDDSADAPVTEPCLDDHMGDCSGRVEFRYPLSGSGRSFPRCDKHWSDRLDTQERINRRYPDSAMPPSDFDPYYAGESWSDDY